MADNFIDGDIELLHSHPNTMTLFHGRAMSLLD